MKGFTCLEGEQQRKLQVRNFINYRKHRKCSTTLRLVAHLPVDTELHAFLWLHCDSEYSCRSGCSSPDRATPSTLEERTSRCTRSGTSRKKLQNKKKQKKHVKSGLYSCAFVRSCVGAHTSPVSSAIKINPKAPGFMLPLPWRRGTVLIVGVGVVVVDIPEEKEKKRDCFFFTAVQMH